METTKENRLKGTMTKIEFTVPKLQDPVFSKVFESSAPEPLNPKPLNPNPKTLNPKTLNPKTLNPEPRGQQVGGWGDCF